MDELIEKFKNLNSEYLSERLKGINYASFKNVSSNRDNNVNIYESIKDSNDIYSEFITSPLVKQVLQSNGNLNLKSLDNNTNSNYEKIDSKDNNSFDYESYISEFRTKNKDDDDVIEDKKNHKVDYVKNNNFEKLLDEVSKKDKRVNHYRPFLRLIAQKESGFRPDVTAVTNKHHGFFQINEGSIKQLSPGNLSVSEYLNNPEAQVITAMNLADQFKKGWTKKDKDEANKLGYNEFSMLSGAWLGGNGGLRKFLHQGINLNDSHHYTKDGTNDPTIGANMRDRMNLFKNIKDGKE